MKKLFVATAAFAGLSTNAGAADLRDIPPSAPPPALRAPIPYPVAVPAGPIPIAVPIAPPPMPVPVAVPIFTWNGFYAGVNAGYSFGIENRRRFTTASSRGRMYSVVPGAGVTFGREGHDGGLLGGGQVGYNAQFGSFVGGIEADVQAADMPRTANAPAGGVRTAKLRGGLFAPEFGVAPSNVAAGNVFFRSNENEVDLFSTVRGRVGMAFGNVMFYGTGGLALRTGEASSGAPPVGFYSPLSPGAAARGRRVLNQLNNESNTDVGWTVGAGIEYAFGNNMSAKIEGLYVNLGDGSNVAGVTNTGRAVRTTSNETEFALVRAGLNYRFNAF